MRALLAGAVLAGAVLAGAVLLAAGPALASTPAIATLQAGRLPPDYASVVAAEMAKQASDPASVVTTVTATPYGGLVCGTAVGRNPDGRMGGRIQFWAWFGPDGRFVDMQANLDAALFPGSRIDDPVRARIIGDCGFGR